MRIINKTELQAFLVDKYGTIEPRFGSSKRFGGQYRLKWSQFVNYQYISKSIIDVASNSDGVILFNEYGIWENSEVRALENVLAEYFFNVAEFNRESIIKFDKDDNGMEQLWLYIGLFSGWGGLLLIDKSRWMIFDHEGSAILNCEKSYIDKLEGVDGLLIEKIKDGVP